MNAASPQPALDAALPADAAADALQICVICDGTRATRMMAAFLAQLPIASSRMDLALSEALEVLHQHEGPPYDCIILAPDPERVSVPHMVNAVLAVAAPLCHSLIALAPPGVAPPWAQLPKVQLRQGPPFNPPAAEAEQAIAPPSAAKPWSRLFARARPPSAAPPTKSAPSAQPLAPYLPVNLPELPLPTTADAAPGRRVIAVQPLCGGAGASLLTVALAQELARMKAPPEICILDLDLQFGSVATYLDLPAEPRIIDAYRNLAAMDAEAFQTCLQPAGDGIKVFAAPAEILPVDGMSCADLARILNFARDCADLVLIDLPHLIADWSGTAYAEADLILGLCLADVRSARNTARLKALLDAEAMPAGRMVHVLNRTPLHPNRSARAELAEFERGIGSTVLHSIPEGGSSLGSASNAGLPLWQEASLNPARLAIRALATKLRPSIGMRRLHPIHLRYGGTV